MSPARRHPSPTSLIIPLAAIIILSLGGCADMPVIQPPPGEPSPIGNATVALGPYLTSSDGMQPFFRFVTSRRTVGGIQSLNSNRKYVNRQGSFSLFHSLAVPELDSGTAKPYQLWLGDADGGRYAVRGLPRAGQATTIAFAGGTAGDWLPETANRLRALDPSGVVFITSPFGTGAPAEPVEWQTGFFGQLGDAVALGPLWFAPGGNLPRELFPENEGEHGYWKRDLGSVRLIGLDARAFSFDSSREAALRRLEMDLDPGHTSRAWTVVVLSRTAFDARVGDGRILGALGDLLEAGGVDLVIGAGEYYMRTRPFSAGGRGETRYISLADPTIATAQIMQPREYVAAISAEPHVARLWADEGTLEWQVFDFQGRPLDVLTLDSRREPLEPALAKAGAAQDAQAALTLQREVLQITRQAARAVPEPNRDTLLALYFSNPTTGRFAGDLVWDVPAGSGWVIEPTVMPFDLQPGQGAAARFRVVPGMESSPPRLTASSPDVGSSTEPFFLTREKRYDVYPAPDAVRLDARIRDKLYWKTLPVITGFETVSAGAAASPTEARITADQGGLIVAVSMAARGVSAGNPRASNPEADRDGPVLEDESLEIYIDPSRQGRDYFHFAVNPRNVILDESSRTGPSYNPVWRRVVRFGRIDGIETWDVEMRLPWEALGRAGPPAANEEWSFQFVRRDYSALRDFQQQRRLRGTPPQPEITSWARTFGDNTRPGLYGILRFGDISAAPAPADGGSRAPAPGGFIQGGGQLPGRLPGMGGGFLPPVPEPPAPDM